MHTIISDQWYLVQARSHDIITFSFKSNINFVTQIEQEPILMRINHNRIPNQSYTISIEQICDWNRFQINLQSLLFIRWKPTIPWPNLQVTNKPLWLTEWPLHPACPSHGGWSCSWDLSVVSSISLLAGAWWMPYSGSSWYRWGYGVHHKHCG